MSRSSLLEAFPLALGPSLSLTMGAFNAGLKFRSLVSNFPFQEENRIIIEFLGEFSSQGKAFNADIAVLAGLAGYKLGKSKINLRFFFEKIKKAGGFQLQSNTWPFTVESDLVYNKQKLDIPNKRTIRFHLLNHDKKVIFQSELHISATGQVLNTPDIANSEKEQKSIEIQDSFSTVIEICKQENLTLIDYLLSYEKAVYSVLPERLIGRLANIWEIMLASIENGLNTSGKLPNGDKRQASKLLQNFHDRIISSELIGQEQSFSYIFTQAVCEENLDNQLIIGAPICETSGIVPAVLRVIQKKYRIPDEKISEALIIAGFVGTILQQIDLKNGSNLSFLIATAMACAAGIHLINPGSEMLNKTINIAITLSGKDRSFCVEELINLNLKHSNLALQAINLSLCDYNVSEIPFDQFFLLHSF